MPRLPDTFLRLLDSNGAASSGALLYVYRAGTTTAVNTYSDAAMTTANAHPIVADAAGAFGAIYLPSGIYKLRATDADGVELPGSPIDNVRVADEAVSAASRTDAAAMAIYPTETVTLTGYAADGDGGGAVYAYSASEPTHDAKFQDAGGNWYALASRPIAPQMFHATDDDAAWASMATYIGVEAAAGRWRYGFETPPDMVDGKGKEFTLADDLTIEEGVHFHNMKVNFNSCTLTLGEDLGAQENVWKWDFTAFHAKFAGGADYDGAMIYLPKSAASSFDSTCTIDAGTDVYRARYGVYAGRYYAFGLHWTPVQRGGECALRVGRDNDQTSLYIAPTIGDRSRLYNIILCSPKGSFVKFDAEHSEGYASLAITSSASQVAEGVQITCGYSFDNNTDSGLPDGATVKAFADCRCIMIGRDLPGTEGWDGGTGVITSDSGTSGITDEMDPDVRTYSAKNITISHSYLVSDNCEHAIDFSGIGALTIEKCTWGGTPDSGTIKLLRVHGPCDGIRIKDVNNQNTGDVLPVIDITGVTTDSIPLWSRAKVQFSWSLVGATVPGGFTYGRQNGAVTIIDNVAYLEASVTWSAVTTQPEGDMTLDGAPSNAIPAADNRAGGVPTQAGFRGSAADRIIQVQMLEGDDFLTLEQLGSSTAIDGAEIQGSGKLVGNWSYHMDPWD